MSNRELGTIKIELSAETTSIIERLLAALAQNAGVATSPKTEVKTEKVSKPKKEMKTVVTAAHVEEVTELGDDLPNADEDDLFGDDEKEVAAKEVSYTSTDILAGFKAYAKRHDRDAARAVLTSFGYKSVQDVEPKNYTKVMQMIA